MHRQAAALRLCSRFPARSVTSTSTAILCRSIAASASRHASEAPPTDEAVGSESFGNVAAEPMAEEGGETPRSYRQFLQQIGHQYRYASGKSWLGGDVPFPMNPSFKPPPPISDRQREVMWQLFSRNNREYSVRRLAKRFNLSIKRVDAILRLKGMEKDWAKGTKLQTGFLQGMEKVLSAQTHSAIPRMKTLLNTDGLGNPEWEVYPERSDVHKADMLEEEERRDATRYRYERLYWESIPEDADEPILPNILQHVKKRAEIKQRAEDGKKKRFMRIVPNSRLITRPKNPILIKHRKGRPATKFVDIGAEFIDVAELNKRAAVAERKARIRVKKAQEKRLTLGAAR